MAPHNPFLGKPDRKKSGAQIFWLLALIGTALVLWILWPRDHTVPQMEFQTAKPPTNRPPPRVVSAVSAVPSTNPPRSTSVMVATPQAPVPVPLKPAPIVLSNSPPNRIAVAATNYSGPRPVQNIFEAQLVLARRGISPGSLDGTAGPQTRAALRVFQESLQLPATGVLDVGTKSNLVLAVPPYTNYVVTSNDLGRLQPVASTWLGKSQQTALDYETILELVAEKFWAHPNFIRRLNPQINWTNVTVDTALLVPNVEKPPVRARASFIRIRLAEKNLEAFDAETNLLAHFPCSIAQRVEKRPVGQLRVQVFAANPNYVFDPDNFPESAEARELQRKLIIPPGPNNPVGVAWIGLDRPGYGIHGTPKPEDVGRTESHGCFRLANWNAEFLLRLVSTGTTVFVEP